MLEILNKNNAVIDWIDFYEDSIKCKWKPDRTLIRIQSSVSDVYGYEVGNEVVNRLRIYISSLK